MLIIELNALSNGAHRNQQGNFGKIPEGWARVPPELETQALTYLPFIDLIIEYGRIVGVAQGEIPEPTSEPPAPPDPQADTDEMLIDIAFRLTLLELGVM